MVAADFKGTQGDPVAEADDDDDGRGGVGGGTTIGTVTAFGKIWMVCGAAGSVGECSRIECNACCITTT